MQVVPVIDLKAREVVHARQGLRDTYRPISTPLSRGSSPADVVAGLLGLHPFASLYVADLDAIAGEGGNAATLAHIAVRWPALELWVDSGIADAEAGRAWLDRGPGALVLGSESQRDTRTVRALAADPRAILSLDFRGEQFQGPDGLLEDVTLWPARVIVMTLARVGAGAGPDLPRVRSIVARAGRRSVYAAGGVRDAGDLLALAEAGAAGVLVASALHAGTIGAADLSQVDKIMSAQAAERAGRLLR